MSCSLSGAIALGAADSPGEGLGDAVGCRGELVGPDAGVETDRGLGVPSGLGAGVQAGRGVGVAVDR